jgi:hypothetical protein
VIDFDEMQILRAIASGIPDLRWNAGCICQAS